MSLSQRVQAIKPSATLAVAAKASQLKAEGKDIIGLGTGEPDFDTPNHIKEAAIKAIRDGQTKYTAVDGTPELKQAIILKLQRDNQLSYTPDQILACNGGKQVVFNLAQALLNPGDEVIIPAPYWVSYPDICKIVDATPVIIPSTIENHYKISADQLREAITDKTKLVIINSPSNPTGIAYSHQELVAFAEVLLAYPNITILTDDIYEPILWTEEKFANIVMLCPELKNRTIVLNGVSKAYAMTGWRIGYAAGDKTLIAAMKKVQSQSTSNPCSISQAAATAALSGDQVCVSNMCKAFKERHDPLYQRLATLPGIKCLPSDGTFYSFPNVQAAIDNMPGINNDIDFTTALINEVGLALVPGSAFGAPGCIRLSFACSLDTLMNAVDRLERFL